MHITSINPHAPFVAARAHPRHHVPFQEVYAALDLGTNNCRLLIAAAVQGDRGAELQVVDGYSRIVRLGEGVKADGVLSDAAMERAVAALKVCRSKLDRYKVTRWRYVATEACRKASNVLQFLKMVKEATGLKIEVISAEEEAHLALLGCASLLGPEHPNALVFDIGGGSTECLWVALAPADVRAAYEVRQWISVGYGVMNLAESFGAPAHAQAYFDEMVQHLMRQFAAIEGQKEMVEAMRAGTAQMLSTSGTVTTLAAMALGLPRYERARVDGACLPMAQMHAVVNEIRGMRPSERFAHPCIGPDRSEFIMSGCAIFQAITNLWPAERITVADRGVREGIILSLLESPA